MTNPTLHPGTSTRKENSGPHVPVPARASAVSGRAEGRVGEAIKPAWFVTKDGDATLLALYRRHYPVMRKKGAWKIAQFVGPGESIVLRSDRGDAGFVWRKFIDDSQQRGINNAFFRNESDRLSSELIRQADAVADVAWPGARHYTFVDAEAVRSTNPGFCYVAAGWRRATTLSSEGATIPLLTESGLLVFERMPCGGCV